MIQTLNIQVDLLSNLVVENLTPSYERVEIRISETDSVTSSLE